MMMKLKVFLSNLEIVLYEQLTLVISNTGVSKFHLLSKKVVS